MGHIAKETFARTLSITIVVILKVTGHEILNFEFKGHLKYLKSR